MAMKIRLNGEEHSSNAATVLALLREQRIDAAARGVAVAVNDAVVARSAWATTALHDGDSVEIVKPFRGG